MSDHSTDRPRTRFSARSPGPQMTENERNNKYRLEELEGQVWALETSHLRVRLTIAILLLLGGSVSPVFTWPYSRRSWAGDRVEATPVDLISGGSTYWRLDWMTSQDEWILDNIGFSIAMLAIAAVLVVTVIFLISLRSREVGRVWGTVGSVMTVLLCLGLAWLAGLVFTTGGHYTAGIGLYLLAGGAVGAVMCVFGMRRFWNQ